MSVIDKLLNQYFFDDVLDKIKKTKREIIKLEIYSKNDLDIKSSKIGGIGYLPYDVAYPLNQNKEPLTFLAQINFAEMPSLKGIPNKGILSFYIDTNDDFLGMNFDDERQLNYRVLYFDNTEKKHNEDIIEFYNKVSENEYPVVQGQFEIIGKLDYQYLIENSLEFENYYQDNLYKWLEKVIVDDKIRDQFNEKLYYHFVNTHFQIGGYPAFVQYDPRYNRNKDDILLLQLDTLMYEDEGISWGECGVANFFINKEDLLKKDFSKVWFNWDCC